MLPERIQTDRLVLRAPRSSDAQAIFESYAQDEVVTRYLMWAPHRSVDDTEAFLEECREVRDSGTGWPYVITLRESGELMGMIDLRANGDYLTLGYVLAQRWWRAGYMTEALASVCTHALSISETATLRATCDCANDASRRLLEACGFGEVRRDLCHFPAFGEQNRECVVYELHESAAG